MAASAAPARRRKGISPAGSALLPSIRRPPAQLDHTLIMPECRRTGHGFPREAPDDHRLVVAHHGVAKAQEDVRCGHPLLLPVDDVRFGEDRAAAGELGMERACPTRRE